MIDDCVVIVKKNEYLSRNRNTLCSEDINIKQCVQTGMSKHLSFCLTNLLRKKIYDSHCFEVGISLSVKGVCAQLFWSAIHGHLSSKCSLGAFKSLKRHFLKNFYP